ncbi:hypothetical protein DJ66_0428 [Candidatus Liberibacter solanacearum]|uniref:Uncharacterized protein n=1 Tax=Candidatus Liberibacter solanacearum TaxID=556287 RepID=A0A0F4VJS0_9HYPH|nr:hypothetical protein [Candidatus Liberibacter solanacearum]KJZ81706.1 hypothetical protein DJ66_0428 [Candidatus Liberibacter solanacearum]
MEKEVKNSLNWKEIGQRFRDLRRGNNYTQSHISELSSQQRGNIP